MRAARAPVTDTQGEDMTKTEQVEIEVSERMAVTPPKPFERVELAPAGEPSLLRIIERAVEMGAGVEALEKIVALQERVQAGKARAEFFAALAAFQRDCPPVPKTKTARITPRSGASYEYDFAPLDVIAEHIRQPLAAQGLSYTWDSTVEGGKLTCVCSLRHLGGHVETASFTLPIDNPSGMSEQQKVASALTFAKRQTLTSVAGITTADTDDDAGEEKPVVISERQAADLEALADEVNVDKAKFLGWLKAETFAGIRADKYDAAVRELERRRR